MKNMIVVMCLMLFCVTPVLAETVVRPFKVKCDTIYAKPPVQKKLRSADYALGYKAGYAKGKGTCPEPTAMWKKVVIGGALVTFGYLVGRDGEDTRYITTVQPCPKCGGKHPGPCKK